MQTSAAPSELSPLKRAYLALEQAQARCRELERAAQAHAEPIAVVGMACRFPGGADSPEAYWQLLQAGIDAVCDTPPQRYDIEALYDPEPGTPGKINTRRGGFLREPIDRFDAPFFGISPREAESMDPQHRLLLEVAWEALENGAQAGDRLAGGGRDTGVFVGMTSHDYADLHLAQAEAMQVGAHLITGNTHNAAAGRLSYCFGFQGPCVAVDTACSSSLVAVHLAVRSLLGGECRRALAAGVNLILSPTATIALSQGGVLSAEGACRAFDAAATGMVRGEGCAAIVLKRLSDALADGDDVLALIRGSAINQDGPSSGLTVPSGPAQEALIRRALGVAGLEPGAIDFIEAHGTGTPLGDPIELRALASVFGRGRDAAHPLVLGSVKTNLGHLEACSGLAGLLKIVLSLRHGTIPAHLHFNEPTPHVAWGELPFVVPTSARAWPQGERTRRAGVSSFGFSGVNAHVVLEQAPAPARPEPPAAEAPRHLLVLSGRSEAALRESARRHAAHFERHPGLPPGDVCHAAATGRVHAGHRLGVVGDSLAQLRQRLLDFVEDREDAVGWVSHTAAASAPRVAFLFTGQGAQHAGMGRALYEAEPVFREALQRCDALLRPLLPGSLLEVLYGGGDASLEDSPYAQPAQFALQFALAAQWRAWGVEPALVLGHSFGEYAAACVAGVFSLEDGLRLATERGRLVQSLPRDGAMLSVEAPLEVVERVVRPHAAVASVAVCNGASLAVVSGRADAVAQIDQALQALGMRTERLRIAYASHSPLMEPVLDAFERCVASVALNLPQLPLVSNLDGAVAGAAVATPGYWRRHLRETVRFADGLATARARGCTVFIELGPKPTLSSLAQRALAEAGDETALAWLPSLRSGRDDLEQMLESLAGAHARGVAPDWAGVHGGRSRRRVALPTSPFQRERCWLELPAGAAALPRATAAGGREHPLLGTALDLPASAEWRFQSRIGREAPVFLQDHCVFDEAVLPAASYLDMAASAACAALDAQADVVLENVTFERALTLPAGQMQSVQTVLRPADGAGDAFDFEIHSRGPDARAPAWARHAAGRLRRATPAEAAPAPQDPARLAAQAGTAVDVAALYRGCQERGIGLGPRFQALQRVWREGDTAFGEIALSPRLHHGAGDYLVHPVLLDAALQVLGGVYAGRDERDVYLPVALDRLVVHRRGGVAGWSRVRSQAVGPDHARSLRVDVELLDMDGQAVARLDGLWLKLVDRELWRASAATASFADWLYQAAWPVDDSEPPQPQPGGQAQSWLILAPAQSALAEALQREVLARGDTALLVRPGPDEALSADFERLLQEPNAPAHIVNLWPTDPAARGEPAVASRLGVEAALQLLQAVARARLATPPQLWFVTQEAQPAGERPLLEGLLQAPVAGLAKVAALEHPELRIVCVDLDDAEPADAARRLHAEILRPASAETEVALRGTRRHVARLVRHAATAPRRPVAVRADATYLVTGGLRGLGLETARWLAAQGARHMVLLGRGEASAEAEPVLDEIRRSGARVLALQGDVSDVARLEAVLADIDAQLPPLRGIVHAAGVLDDGILAQYSAERLRRVLAPKLQGAWNLHQLTRERRLDFFVMYSSLASLFGSTGQGSYVAANAFLDALAHHRRLQGLPALAVGWGVWSDVGLAARGRVEQRTAAQGLGSIATAQGMAVLQHLLGSGAAQVGVSPIDWPTFTRRAGAARIPAFFEHFAAVRAAASGPGERGLSLQELQAAAPAQRAQLLATQLRAQVAAVLRLPADEVDPERPLNRLGLDSMMAVELRNRLRGRCGLDVPLVRFLGDASIQALAAQLAEQLGAPAQPPTSTPAAAGDADGLMSQLDALSDDEVDALLDAALAGAVPKLP